MSDRRLVEPRSAIILIAQLMVVLDATIVNIALPKIQTALSFSRADLSWVLNAYALTFGGLLLLGARSGDLFGRRRVFLAGIAPLHPRLARRRLHHVVRLAARRPCGARCRCGVRVAVRPCSAHGAVS